MAARLVGAAVRAVDVDNTRTRKQDKTLREQYSSDGVAPDLSAFVVETPWGDDAEPVPCDNEERFDALEVARLGREADSRAKLACAQQPQPEKRRDVGPAAAISTIVLPVRQLSVLVSAHAAGAGDADAYTVIDQPGVVELELRLSGKSGDLVFFACERTGDTTRQSMLVVPASALAMAHLVAAPQPVPPVEASGARRKQADVCPVCKKEVVIDAIQCAGCGKWIHIRCAGLVRDDCCGTPGLIHGAEAAAALPADGDALYCWHSTVKRLSAEKVHVPSPSEFYCTGCAALAEVVMTIDLSEPPSKAHMRFQASPAKVWRALTAGPLFPLKNAVRIELRFSAAMEGQLLFMMKHLRHKFAAWQAAYIEEEGALPAAPAGFAAAGEDAEIAGNDADEPGGAAGAYLVHPRTSAIGAPRLSILAQHAAIAASHARISKRLSDFKKATRAARGTWCAGMLIFDPVRCASCGELLALSPFYGRWVSLRTGLPHVRVGAGYVCPGRELGDSPAVAAMYAERDDGVDGAAAAIAEADIPGDDHGAAHYAEEDIGFINGHVDQEEEDV